MFLPQLTDVVTPIFIVTRCHVLHFHSWASEGFFPGVDAEGFFQNFFRGGPKAVKFVFPAQNKKNTFFAENFKIQGKAGGLAGG